MWIKKKLEFQFSLELSMKSTQIKNSKSITLENIFKRTGINSGSEDANQNREPVTLSLFPEYFEDEDERFFHF
jgi:hypothetical protein